MHHLCDCGFSSVLTVLSAMLTVLSAVAALTAHTEQKCSRGTCDVIIVVFLVSSHPTEFRALCIPFVGESAQRHIVTFVCHTIGNRHW